MSEVEGSRSDHIRSRFVRYCRVRVRSARSWEKRNYLCYSHTSSPHLFHQQLASSNKDNMASAGTSRQKHRLQQQNGEWLFQYFLAFPSPACYSNSWLHKPIVHWRRLASGASNWKANKCKKHERKLFPCSRNQSGKSSLSHFNFSQLSQKSAQNYETRWTKGVRAKKSPGLWSLFNQRAHKRERGHPGGVHPDPVKKHLFLLLLFRSVLAVGRASALGSVSCRCFSQPKW